MRMQRYNDSDHDAGVTAYQIGADWIKIRFKDRSTYLYTWDSTGKDNIDKMQKLAVKGAGLTTFINQHVREHYAAQLE